MKFGVTGKNYGKNENRRENIVQAGVYPSELLKEVVPKDDLKDIVDEYGLDAHKLKTEDMVSTIIEYFEQSQKSVEEGEPEVDLYLDAYQDIADGAVTDVPPQLQDLVDADNPSEKLDFLFGEAWSQWRLNGRRGFEPWKTQRAQPNDVRRARQSSSSSDPPSAP